MSFQAPSTRAWARQRDLVVITNDLDFSAILAAGAVDGPSVVQIRAQDLVSDGAIRIVAKALDLRAIQLLLGHADLKTTQRYLNVTDGELRRTMQEKLWARQ